jgi:DNA-directed RNA polymerase subunit M/transcription elongation factor TFIIS
MIVQNPENFRTNVKIILGDMLDYYKYGDNLEKGIYNFTLLESDKRNIIKKWNNTYFIQIYVNKYRTIYNNLKNDNVKYLITEKKIKPHKLAFMTHQEMLPEKWNKLIEDIKIKNNNKYTPKLEASTSDFECIKCMDIERKKAKKEKREIDSSTFTQCTYYQLQTRSADEPMTTFVTCIKCNTRWKC